ncbi:MAG: J domain-containing protein [Rhodospirillum sp.]|nr:J domain-containing protein [Rhodospirillum sp.]MCF8489783.1 J domain-containing protein [Rhodospirillum sp.]MCF8500495.1 J domain-containing protein [Rhodospirillum sp.]
MRDPYTVLGLARNASPEEIKSAYRKLARTMHPDVNRDDPKAEDKFKEISGAHELLSDPQKRARFDRGEIDAQGNERGFRPGPGAGAGGFRGRRGAAGGGGPRPGAGFGGFNFDSMFADDDVISDMLRQASRGPGGPGAHPQRGQDAQYRLKVTFVEAALGCTKRITLTNRKTLDVRIPPGWEDGKAMRLKGQGGESPNGGPKGDALVEIGIKDHAFFKREGQNVALTLPVTLKEAVLGAKVAVPTLEGKVSVTVPEGSNSGATLRLRGKGIPGENDVRGDLLVKLSITLDDPKDDKLVSLVKKLKDPDIDPREKAGLFTET